MAKNCLFPDALARLCCRARECASCRPRPPVPRPCPPPYPPPCPRPCPGPYPPPCPGPCPPPYPPPGAACCPAACRELPFWPCWNSDAEIERRRPQPRCLRCGSDELERQGRFVRCCQCGWIGFFEECCPQYCLRSCCDNLFWPDRPGEPE